jgi:N-acetylmuramoyl-L-alanine amidase
LHNPERHVIDLEKPEAFDEATVAAFETNPYLKTVRIGTPDKNTCRIVLDLSDENVGVAERTYIGDDKLLTVTLSPAPQPAPVAVSTQNGQQTIVLDAGHGGSDPGAQRGDIQEKEMTLAIVQQLQKRLEGQGFKIVMTRVDDTFVSLEDRVKLTNQIMPSAFVSVHINALESTSDIHGIETYFQTEQSRPLAEVIHSSLVNGLGVPDRGIRKARFYVINHTPVPAILAEVGFISNKEERDKLNSFDYQGKVADAISQGVMLYLGKSSITQKVPAHPALASDGKPAGKGTTGKASKSVASSFPASTKHISR